MGQIYENFENITNMSFWKNLFHSKNQSNKKEINTGSEHVPAEVSLTEPKTKDESLSPKRNSAVGDRTQTNLPPLLPLIWM